MRAEWHGHFVRRSEILGYPRVAEVRKGNIVGSSTFIGSFRLFLRLRHILTCQAELCLYCQLTYTHIYRTGDTHARKLFGAIS